jgi:hypothetical protein
VALLDRSFFNRGGHPARKLLNELASAGIGWNPKAESQRDPLRDKVESVVERLLSEFTDNVSLFQEVLEDFTHFMDLDRRRRDLVEQRLRDAEEGRARQERARMVAAQTLEPIHCGHRLPDTVTQLIEQPWARYMQFLYLREGEDSDAWRMAVATAEKLVWSVDPQPVTSQTRADLLRELPVIVDELRRGLHSISWDPFASDSLIRDLEMAHVNTLQQLALKAPAKEPAASEVKSAAATAPVEETPSSKAFQVPQAQSMATPESIASRPEQPAEHARVAPQTAPARAEKNAEITGESTTSEIAAALDPETAAKAQEADPGEEPHWHGMARKLRVGSWVEVVNDSQKMRCKLAAVIKATGKFIFVNRTGAKIAEYDLDQVAAAMECGEISLLDDGLIFDRALESIIDSLRHNRRD